MVSCLSGDTAWVLNSGEAKEQSEVNFDCWPATSYMDGAPGAGFRLVPPTINPIVRLEAGVPNSIFKFFHITPLALRVGTLSCAYLERHGMLHIFTSVDTILSFSLDAVEGSELMRS